MIAGAVRLERIEPTTMLIGVGREALADLALVWDCPCGRHNGCVVEFAPKACVDVRCGGCGLLARYDVVS